MFVKLKRYIDIAYITHMNHPMSILSSLCGFLNSISVHFGPFRSISVHFGPFR